jgi:hypothetical protein
MPYRHYEGVVALYNGVDAEQRIPFLNCSIQRIDQYNVSQGLVQRGPMNYTLGNMRFEGELSFPLFDRQFTMVWRWLINCLKARIVVTYGSDLSHAYYDMRPTRVHVSCQVGGMVVISVGVMGLYSAASASAYASPIDSSAFPINDLVTWKRTAISGGGVVGADVCGWDLSIDTGATEVWTGNTWPYQANGSTAWYRRPYDVLPGGPTVTGAVNFLNPQSALYNGDPVAFTLGANTLYLSRMVWQAGGLNVAGASERLKISVPFQSMSTRRYYAIHV